MAYQSKTYSLSDEVIEAIEAARQRGLSPNKFLRRLLKLDDNNVEFPPLDLSKAVRRQIRERLNHENADKPTPIIRSKAGK